ncbi:hypothetical protein [Zooshikella sp. RANM57]|uniref:hypothetical protein n=1 Tax=Zooshikella sp. RANM57 TaxID=3425863 RepID=UPI003D6FA2AD
MSNFLDNSIYYVELKGWIHCSVNKLSRRQLKLLKAAQAMLKSSGAKGSTIDLTINKEIVVVLGKIVIKGQEMNVVDVLISVLNMIKNTQSCIYDVVDEKNFTRSIQLACGPLERVH